MEVDELEIGAVYKIDLPHVKTRDKYVLLRTRQAKNEAWEVECVLEKNYDKFKGVVQGAKVRTFLPENLVPVEVKKKGERKVIENQIITNKISKIDGPWGDGVELWDVEVVYWPKQAKRGRKKQNG